MCYNAPPVGKFEAEESTTSTSFLSDLSESDDTEEELPIRKAIVQNISENSTKMEEDTAEIHGKDRASILPESTSRKLATTRCEATLAAIDDLEFQKYLDFTIEKPQSMERKEVWVSRLFNAFCHKAKVENPFPLSGSLVCGFIHFLAVPCGYALNGIEAVVVPCLRHLHIQKCGSEDKGTVMMIKKTLRALRSNPKVKLHGKGKEPLCSFDLAELISRIPDRLDTKLQEASLFLFALHSGARALTCSNLTWGDIKRVDATDLTTGVWRVIVILRVTKGNPNWDHPICIEGWPDQKNPLDVVYYLNQFCITVHKKSLLQISDRTSGPNEFDEQTVWQMSKEAMRGRLKRRLEQAGFPARLWSFHSFRSGHICSALLAAGGDPGRRGNVLDVTAVVAGWKARGRAQRGYIKVVTEKQIVCSRLLGLGIGMAQEKSKEDNPVLQPTDTTPPTSSQFIYAVNSKAAAEGYVHSPASTEEFHLITLKQPNFSLRMYTDALRRQFASYFPIDGCKKAIVHHRHNCFTRVLVEFARNAQKGPTDYQSLIRTGRAIVTDRLSSGEDPKLLAAEMIKKVYDMGDDPQLVPDPRVYHVRYPFRPEIQRETVTGRTGKVSRHRVRWTPEEDALLIETRKLGKQFAEIRTELEKYGRQSEDANHRWKVLIRSQPDLSQYKVHTGRKAKSTKKQS